MSELIADDFSDGSISDWTTYVASVDTAYSEDGSPDYGVYLYGAAYFYKDFGSTETTAAAKIRCKFKTASGAITAPILGFWQGATEGAFLYKSQNAGEIYVRYNNTSYTMGTGLKQYMSTDIWYDIEFKVFVDGSIGVIEAKIGGGTTMQFRSGDTAKGGALTGLDRFRIGYQPDYSNSTSNDLYTDKAIVDDSDWVSGWGSLGASGPSSTPEPDVRLRLGKQFYDGELYPMEGGQSA